MSYKSILFSVVVLSILFCSSNPAQEQFEGKITMRVSSEKTSSDKPMDMDYFIKGSKFRVEMKSDHGNSVILHDQKDQKTYMVMPDQKMYMELDANSYISKSNSKSEEQTPDIQKTGEFKELNGYKCEKWIIKEENETIVAWMTDQLSGFYMMNDPMTSSSKNAWMQELAGNYMPMKVENLGSNENKVSLEVVSVNKMKLSSDLFEVPKDFQKFQMPNMNVDKQK
jgi:hypothetical protein